MLEQGCQLTRFQGTLLNHTPRPPRWEQVLDPDSGIAGERDFVFGLRDPGGARSHRSLSWARILRVYRAKTPLSAPVSGYLVSGEKDMEHDLSRHLLTFAVGLCEWDGGPSVDLRTSTCRIIEERCDDGVGGVGTR